MTNAITTTRTAAPDALAIEQVLVGGDLSKLNPAQRLTYYDNLCDSLGLNKLTKPFEYLTLNGKTVLYARRDCTDQLRKIHTVSIKVISRETIEELMVVTTQASTPDGRTDESIGAVSIAGLKGEALANAIMKADTKAKRRVTLSICGLGMLDESELDGARAAQPLASGLPRISPTSEPEDDPAGVVVGDEDVFESFRARLVALDADIQACDSYDKALECLARVGTPEKQSELTKQMQKAYENGGLNGDMRSALGRLWQRCSRQVKIKLEKLKTDATAAFSDADPEQDGR